MKIMNTIANNKSMFKKMMSILMNCKNGKMMMSRICKSMMGNKKMIDKMKKDQKMEGKPKKEVDHKLHH